MNAGSPNLKSIFGAALGHHDGSERAAYLDAACRDNPALRQQVESLLNVFDEADRFLRSSSGATPGGDFALEGPPADPPDLRHLPPPLASTASANRPAQIEGAGAEIGPYRLLQKIGEGGMGTVFMAEQLRPIRRKVALKVIKPGMDSDQVIARFEAERQALAMMDHPNIARVLDVGATTSGRPYFVMELVRGVPITEYCTRNHLAPRERLELFISVCWAIQHAHQKGIIHRDIKPSNVLVTLHDGIPEPKVIDFGVAKAIEQRLTERTMFTEFGVILGTLEYMSPEQAEMGALDIDTRSDIYSLGVLLYELLTGSTPLERGKIRQASYTEILRRIREEEPTRPSTRLSQSEESVPAVSAQRRLEPARLSRLVRGDLDWIVMKALEKDRTRRYETASGFARDIQRHLDGDAVEACPPSATYKLRKLARKHRAALVTVGSFGILLALATTLAIGLAVWANRERLRVSQAEVRGQAREQIAIDAASNYSRSIRNSPELKNDPRLIPLRNTLLSEARALFQQLDDRLNQESDTRPGSLARLATVSFESGILSEEIGDSADALAAFEQTRAIRSNLVRDHPGNVEYRADLGLVLHRIGNLQLALDHPERALAAFEQALPNWRRLVADDPSTSRFLGDLTWSLTRIAAIRHDDSRLLEVLEAYRTARPLRERLAREHPKDLWYQLDRVTNHFNMGTLQSVLKLMPESLQTFQETGPMWEQLKRDYPRVARYPAELASTLHNIGELQRQLRQTGDARKSFERSWSYHQELIRDFDPTPDQVVVAARTLRQLALLDEQDGEFGPGRAKLVEAIELINRFLASNPGHQVLQATLKDCRADLGRVDQLLSRPATAAIPR